jgi:hypothetical protein
MTSKSYQEHLIRQANESDSATASPMFFGEMQMIPQMVGDMLRADKVQGPVLDYGAGVKAPHANSLRERGFEVYAHEIGENVRKRTHREDALSHAYALVYASNVLNVQGSKAMLEKTLKELRAAVWEEGVLICNLPLSPRYAAWSGPAGRDAQSLHNQLRGLFGSVEVSGGTANAPIFVCKNVEFENLNGRPTYSVG